MPPSSPSTSLPPTSLPSTSRSPSPPATPTIRSESSTTSSTSTLLTEASRSPCPISSPSPTKATKVVNFILQTMDPTNTVMRKTCIQTSLAALKEVTRAFPMVTALNDSSTKLVVGDALGEMRNSSIWVYDIQSVTKIKVLDASGPPGLPSLLPGSTELEVTTLISALSFSPYGEGLDAFSEHGLMIRWWSLGSAWWEKLS